MWKLFEPRSTAAKVSNAVAGGTALLYCARSANPRDVRGSRAIPRALDALRSVLRKLPRRAQLVEDCAAHGVGSETARLEHGRVLGEHLVIGATEPELGRRARRRLRVPRAFGRGIAALDI